VVDHYARNISILQGCNKVWFRQSFTVFSKLSKTVMIPLLVGLPRKKSAGYQAVTSNCHEMQRHIKAATTSFFSWLQPWCKMLTGKA